MAATNDFTVTGLLRQLVGLMGGSGAPSYTLASNAGLAAGTTNATTPVTGISGGSYVFAYQFTQAATVAAVLEALGPDGVTYQMVTAITTTSGTIGIVLGANSTVRIRNNSATNAISALYASLS